ncbi:MAG: NAD(P)/FAD-dependent oxidoreductase, partial [Pseudomonadota bacterium]
HQIGKGFARQTQAIAEATDLDDLFARVEASGQLIRLDESVTPTMYRCATVTQAESTQLKRISNIVRQGRVQALEADRLILDEGEVATDTATLHVDCSADGLARRPAVPVFEGAKLTLQSVRTCQQVFSAAFIAHVEASYADEGEKNELCTPVPHPDDHIDFLRTTLASNRNAARWGADPDLQVWLRNARLDGFTTDDPSVPPPSADTLAEMAQAAQLASANLERLLADYST